MQPIDIARENLRKLSENPYPGRGLILGTDETGLYAVMVYWIMGRSANSRNRIFSQDDGRVFTEAANPAEMKDPSLVIYNAMLEDPKKGYKVYYVSNGNQTDAMMLGVNIGIDEALRDWKYEPDGPNFTPRISGWVNLCGRDPEFRLFMLRKSLFGEACDRIHYNYKKISQGFGYCLTTYQGDGNPLPSFQGEPLLMPLTGPRQMIAETFWNALNEENRVSLAVKFISLETGDSETTLVNKYEKV